MKLLIEKLGGIDITANSETVVIKTIGGFDKYLNPNTQNIVVGDIAKTFVKNKITEWQTFKDVYYENGSLNPKYYDKLIDVVNIIFPLPVNSEECKELTYMITTMYNSSDAQFLNGMNTIFNLLYSFKLTLRHLFMTWKVYLEKLIEIFVKLRNNYIETNKLEKKNKKNDFYSLINRWSEIDIENKVDTSSPILFFNFPPKKAKLENTIPSIEFRINGTDSHISNSINVFLKNSKKFAYNGFCINMVIKRFNLLMMFPVSDLLHIIILLDINKKYTHINKRIEKITNEIKKLKKCIFSINDYKTVTINKQTVPKLKDFPKNPKDKIKFYETYIDAYLDIYQQILPLFSKKEKLICELSLCVNLIAADVSKLTDMFDKTLLKNQD
jgi:hypothetical protein